MKKRIPVALFFFALLIAGFIAHDDYGVAWDEPAARAIGAANANHLRTLWIQATQPELAAKETQLYHLDQFGDNAYGVAVELPLFVAEIALGITKDRDTYNLRHLLTFLLCYISVFFFYLTLKRRFNSWKWALLGCSFLILTPQIFAHSFFNSKDMGFLAFYTIALYTLVRFLDDQSIKNASLHGVSTALAICARMPGLLILPITLLFCFLMLNRNPVTKRSLVKTLIGISAYGIVVAFCTILFWPYLWESPIKQFLEAYHKMSQYPLMLKIRYLGQYIYAPDVPWTYIPVWISLTVPLLYQIAFYFGAVSITKSFLYRTKATLHSKSQWIDGVFLSATLLPIAAVIVSGSTLYGGWRHLYFIYPAFIFVAIGGVRLIWIHSKKLRNFPKNAVLTTLLALITLTPLSGAMFMVRHHPHQHLFFNIIGKKYSDGFDLDYWGLSYRNALEHILKTDSRKNIRIVFENTSGWHNLKMLNPEDRNRIETVSYQEIEDADYFISNYFFLEDHDQKWKNYADGKFPYTGEVYNVELQKLCAARVYRINKIAPLPHPGSATQNN